MRKLFGAFLLALVPALSQAATGLTLYSSNTTYYQLLPSSAMPRSYCTVLPQTPGTPSQVMSVQSVSGSTMTMGWSNAGSLTPQTTFQAYSGIIQNNLCVGGIIKAGNYFITTPGGQLDASTLTNPLPYISGANLYALNPNSLNGPFTNLQAVTVTASSAIVNSSLVLNGVSESTPMNVLSGNIGLPYGYGFTYSPTASWPSGTHNFLKVWYNGFDDEADFYLPGPVTPNPFMSFRSTGNQIGIKTTLPHYDFDVNGTVAAKDAVVTYGLTGSTGAFTGGVSVNSGSTASTGLYVMDGNLAINYGKAITVSPTASWPSGTHNLMNVYFNGSDDEVDFFTPGAARADPLMSMRSATGRVGIKQQTPLYDLDVNGNGGYISTGTAPTLKVVANGTYGTTNGTSGGFLMDCTGGGGASGMCGQVYSNAGTQNALDALWYLRANNTLWNEPLLYLSNASSLVQSTIRVDSGWPTLTFIDLSQTSGGSGRKFQMSVHNGVFRIGEGRNPQDNAFDSAIMISSMDAYGDVSIGQGYNPSQNAQLQVIASTPNIYALYVATGTVGGNSIAVSTSAEVLLNKSAGTNGQVMTSAGAGAPPTWATASSGGGAGTVNSGTLGALSYYNVAGSTVSAVPGSLVTATSTTLGLTGLPFVVRSTFTMLHNVEVNSNAGQSSAFPGFFDLYYGDAKSGYTILWDVGSQNHIAQCYVQDQNGMTCSSGYTGASLLMDVSGDGKIRSNQSTNQFIQVYNSGEMDLQTAAFASADIAFKPKTVERFRLSFSTGAVFVGATANKWTLATSTNTSGNYADSNLQVTVSTNGALGYFGRTLAQMATIPPAKPGECFYPSDATVDVICCSTQTVTASWASGSSRTTACH